jgi:hypothetical protein
VDTEGGANNSRPQNQNEEENAMKNKLVLTAFVVVMVLSFLTYLGSTKVHSVTYTVKGDEISEEERQTELSRKNDLIDLKNRDRDFFNDTRPHIPRITSLPPEKADLTIQNGSGGSDQFSVGLPWTMTFPAKSSDRLYLSAQADEGTFHLDVEIRSDGNLVQDSTSSGQYSIATASGSAR